MDPFMGSGTTLIEARHLGFLSEGIELNPLAVLISRAKLDWEKEPEVASIDYHDAVASTPYEFDIATLDYLKKWFPSQTLCEILKLLTYISHFPEPELRIAEEGSFEDEVPDALDPLLAIERLVVEDDATGKAERDVLVALVLFEPDDRRFRGQDGFTL